MMLLLSRRGFLDFWINKRSILGSVVLILILNSCKTVPFSSASAERDFSQYLYKSYISDRSKYYSAEVDLILKNEEIKKIKGKVFVNRGEFIFMNYSFLGIELARAEITPDSIKFINRFDKTYYFGKVGDLRPVLNVDLNYFQIETLIVEGIIAGKSDSKMQFRNRVEESEGHYIYLYENNFNVKSLFDKVSYEQSEVQLGYSDSIIVLQAKLSDYYKDIKYPKRIEINFFNNSQLNEINVMVGKISKDKTESGKFLINSKYREISF